MIVLTYNGETNSLATWGLSDEFVLNTINQRASTLSFRKAVSRDGVVGDADFPYAGRVTLKMQAASNGTGGVTLFQGYRTKFTASAHADGSAFDFTFGDVWFWLDQTCFQQYYKVYNPADPLHPLLAVNSDLFLFRTTAGVMQNTGAQITEILNWANLCFNPTRRPSYVGSVDASQDLLQIGTVDPAVNVPSYQVKDIMCSEAIHNCLRSSPDVTIQIDHSTTPPTMHFRKRTNAVAVALPWRDGETHQSSRLIPREDLQLNYVSLIFKRQNTVDGKTWFDPIRELYPAGWDGIEPGGLIQTIDILGFDKSTVKGSLNVEAVPTSIVTPAGSQIARLTFWEQVHPQFVSTRYRNLTFGDATIKDESGVAVSLADFPNRLLSDSGGIAPWMSLVDNTAITGKKVKVECTAQYDEYDVEATGGDRTAANGLKLHSTVPNGRKFSVNLTLTNGVSGNYSAVASVISPEPIPADLAQSIYDSLSALQFEGTHTIVQLPEANRSIGIQNTLNLTGGNAAWETMNAQVQEITESFSTARRKTVISIGPAEHLAPGDLTQLFLFNRYRTNWNNPAIREQAVVDGGAAELPNTAARENTTDGLPESSHQAIIERPAGDPTGAPTGIIYHAPKEIADILASTTPTPAGTFGVDDIKTMQPREISCCDAAGQVVFVIAHVTGFYTKS